MPDDGRSISLNVVSLGILVHDVINGIMNTEQTSEIIFTYIKKAFFEILQDSQENSCVWVSFLSPEAYNFIKKKTPTQVYFRQYYEIFKNAYFTEQLCAIDSNLF